MPEKPEIPEEKLDFTKFKDEMNSKFAGLQKDFEALKTPATKPPEPPPLNPPPPGRVKGVFETAAEFLFGE